MLQLCELDVSAMVSNLDKVASIFEILLVLSILYDQRKIGENKCQIGPLSEQQRMV